jgi:regulator of protease activity HflC (stomatin/prohibitin superfamily)
LTEGAEGQQKRALNTRGILVLVLISLLVVPLVYWVVGWRAAFVLLLLIPWIAYWRFIPTSFFRVFLYAYLSYAVAFSVSTWLQMQLAQNPKLIAFIDDHALISLFLGGEHGFAKQVLFAIVAGILLGVVVVNIPLWAITYASSEWVLALHQTTGVDRRTAMSYLRSLILGMQYPWMIVDEGKVIQSKPGGVLPEIGGPGLAVIRPGHAVVFERGGKITRVAAPGLIRLEQFERIQDIVELKPMWSSQVLENVLTKDRIPLRITFGVGFHIESTSEANAQPENHAPGGVVHTPVLSDGVYAVYAGSIQKAVFATAADWKTVSFAFGENLLRDIVATLYFDQIFEKTDGPNDSGDPDKSDPDERTIREIEDEFIVKGGFSPDERTIREIEKEIIKRHRVAAPSWGVHTSTVDISLIEPPSKALEKMIEVWAARHAAREELIKARGERYALLVEAKADREAATQRASAHIIEARAMRDAILEKGYAEAEAYAEQLRRVLSSVPDQYVEVIIRQMAQRIGLDNMIQYLSARTSDRRLIGGPGIYRSPQPPSPPEDSASSGTEAEP